MSKKAILGYSVLTLLLLGFVYFYVWEKPKLEKLVEKYVESLSKDDDIPVTIDIGKTNFSLIPLQLEIYETEISFKTEVKDILKPLKVEKVSLRPSLLDLVIGKFWISLLRIEGTKLDLTIPLDEASKDKPKDNKELKLDVNALLKKIPISKLELDKIQLNANIGNRYFATTENLSLSVFNEKSSLFINLKDPNIGIRKKESKESFTFLAEIQGMITSNTLSLSKLKIIKDSSYFIASGNLLYKGTPENFSEILMQTRVKADFSELKEWSNQFVKNDYFDLLKGSIRTDINVSKKSQAADFNIELLGDLNGLQVDDIKIGDINLNVAASDKKQINIKKITATLVGNNQVVIHDSKVHIGDRTDISANIQLNNAQLQTFLKESTIADIPVWLNINGELKCQGSFEKSLNMECPGALTVSNIKIKTKDRNKNIVTAQKIDIAGTAKVTEKQISYQAKASMKESGATSEGVIIFDKGFDIKYSSDKTLLQEVGPIADLKFIGETKLKGSTQGDSRSAVFDIDIDASNFEFQDYFFGQLKTKLDYKSGTLYFKDLKGNLESTRYSGQLNVNLLNETMQGDLQLPFFRMADIQQAILKKVDLQNRFDGSGSGRIRLDSPFDIDRMNFQLDALLFKGQVFGENYNEAQLKAQAVDGIIILQKADLKKEKNRVSLRGTIDTKLDAKLKFFIDRAYLQHSMILKEYNLPISGEVVGSGEMNGPLDKLNIKAKAQVSDLVFNKKKYDEGFFAFDNSKNQTNLQFKSLDQLDMVVIFPESGFKNVFIDLNANKFDVAPLIAYSLSDDATRSYLMETSGEISGRFDFENWWNSEFSSTIRDISINYKANKLKTLIPTNIELKKGQLFLNEFSLSGKKQYFNVIQSSSSKYQTNFTINSRMSIAFFKLFAPFIDKIDGYTNLRLELNVNNNQFKLIGSSYTTDAFLKFPGFPHALENVSVDVLFNQNRISINSISGQVAGGSILGNGEVKFLGKKNIDLSINTNFSDVNLNFPEGYNTQGHGSLSLTGSKLPFLLSGRYEVESGLIENNFSTEGSSESTDLLQELLKKEVTSPLTLNFDIKTRNPVEVRNSLVEGYMLADLRVIDSVNSPRLQGEAHFDDDSVIKFRDQEFEVTSSSFQFEGQSPINPKLSLRAQTRMNNYDIDIFLQGRANKPVLNMSSQPPLPETQIISMLALGSIPNQFDQTNAATGTNTQDNTGGFEVGTSLLSSNPLGKELKERSGFDVQFSSSFDDQSNAAVPKVTLRRKVSKKMQISVSSTTGTTNQQEGRVTYELNNNLSTLFFIRNIPDDTTDNQNTNTIQQSNPFGVDLEYKMEFD